MFYGCGRVIIGIGIRFITSSGGLLRSTGDIRSRNRKKLVTLGKVDFGDKIGMAQTIRDEIKTRSKDKKIFQDTILSENSNTIWIMWGGNE